MTQRRGPQLQLAIDCLTTQEALTILEQVHPYFDIAEVGTPLLIEQGLSALEALKACRSDRRYLADTKIMDAGQIEATSAFARGADLATVLGVADDLTIRQALDAAQQHGARVMVDLINVADPVERARQLEQLGASILCVHTAYDRQSSGIDPLAELERVRRAVSCQLAVAGGLGLDTVGPALAGGADIVVVGGAILNQPDRRAAAKAIYALMDKP